MKIDFTKFKSGEDSLDSWLDDLSSTFFYLKAPLDKEVFVGGFANHRIKNFKLKGQAFLNNVWHSQDIELTLYSTENSVVGTAEAGSTYENVKVNFSLLLHPKDFKIHKKPHHLKKVIIIGVTMGRVNVLQPSMENILGEAYDHH